MNSSQMEKRIKDLERRLNESEKHQRDMEKKMEGIVKLALSTAKTLMKQKKSTKEPLEHSFCVTR